VIYAAYLGLLLPASFVVDDVRTPGYALARSSLSTTELEHAYGCAGGGSGSTATCCGLVVF